VAQIEFTGSTVGVMIGLLPTNWS